MSYILVPVMLVILPLLSSGWAGTGQAQMADEVTISQVYPRLGFPAVVEQGGNLRIEFNLSKPGGPVSQVNDWSLSLVPSHHLRDHVISFSFQPGLEGKHWKSEVEIPSDTPPLLYDLEVKATGPSFQAGHREMHCLQVVRGYKDNLRIVHLTDLHIGDPRGAAEDITQTVEWKAAKRAVEEINTLGPDFVILSGDLVFGQNYQREYPPLLQILEMFEVPFFACIGNHDGYASATADGYDFWLDNIGPLYYSFDYGDFHFVSLNTYDWSRADRQSVGFASAKWGGQIRQPQLDWLNEDLATSNASRNIVFGHHNPLWSSTPSSDSVLPEDQVQQNFNGEGREELLQILDAQRVSTYFAGHVHFDNVTVSNGTTFITTTTCASDHPDGGYWGYRPLLLGPMGPKDYNYAPPDHSVPSYHISSLTQTEDDGMELTVASELERSYVARAVVVIDSDKDIGASNGEIVYRQQLDEGTLVMVEYTLFPGENLVRITPGSYFLMEGRYRNKVFFAPGIEEGAFEILDGCYVSLKKELLGSVQYTFVTDKPLMVSTVRFYTSDQDCESVYLMTGENVPLEWNMTPSGLEVYNITLSKGTTVLMIDVASPEDGEEDEGSEKKAEADEESVSSSPIGSLVCFLFIIIILVIIVALALYFRRRRRIKKEGYT